MFVATYQGLLVDAILTVFCGSTYCCQWSKKEFVSKINLQEKKALVLHKQHSVMQCFSMSL